MKEIIFAGLAKNCLDTLKSNLKFIENFKADFPDIKLSVYIMESDSIDGTKEFINKLNIDWVYQFSEDNLDSKFDYRTEKIAYCRNFLLEKLNKQISNEAIYIPVDFDIEIFQFLDTMSFFKILEKFFHSDDIDALFPFGYPYYYDIHALRANSWNTKSPWEYIRKINKFIPVGKFITRYFIIYKKQKKHRNTNKLIEVLSAFGGIGLYKVIDNYWDATYGINKKLGNNSCEHIQFNTFFKNKFIDSSWIIPSPPEHIQFKILNTNKKIKFVIKDLVSDVKNLIKN